MNQPDYTGPSHTPGTAQISITADGSSITNIQSRVPQPKAQRDPNDWRESGVTTQGLPLDHSELTPEALITIGGVQAKISDHLRAGTMAHANGKYIQASPSAKPQAQPQQPQGYTPPPLHSDASVILDRVNRGEGRNHLISDFLRDGRSSEETAKNAAGRLGVTDAQASRMIDYAFHQLKNQAAGEMFEVTGVAADKGMAWARKEMPAEFERAAREHLNHGQTGGYAKIAKQYLEKLDILEPEAAARMIPEGIRTRKAVNGQLILTNKSFGELSWSQAITAGVIRPGKGKR